MIKVNYERSNHILIEETRDNFMSSSEYFIIMLTLLKRKNLTK